MKKRKEEKPGRRSAREKGEMKIPVIVRVGTNSYATN